MNKSRFSKKDIMNLIIIVLLVAMVSAAFFWVHKLKVAHSSFESYSSFRGCVKVTSRTLTNGTCITVNGENLKIIKADNGKWYLNGDLSFP